MRLSHFVLIAVLLLPLVLAQSLYPTDLLSKIRFYHQHEPFFGYENERALTQCEHYLAQDLAESIEDASFVIGMTTNPLFLPQTPMTTFDISQRFGQRFHFISTFQLQALILHRAYDTFKRQRYMDSSAIMIDELEEEWIRWWNNIQQSIPPVHLQFINTMVPQRQSAN